MMNLIKISDVVNQLSVARQDFDRLQFVRYSILAKSVLRDLKINYLNAFKRVYLQIDRDTMTARLPIDYYKFVTISVIEDCHDRNGVATKKVLPLTHNPYINITPFEVPRETCKVCNCNGQSEVCAEIANFTTICETVTLPDDSTGTRTTILKTCADGTIIKEVCEPTLKFIEGALQCDYSVTIDYNLCDYTLDIATVDPPMPSTVQLIKNGVAINSGSLASAAAMDAFFAGLGWTVDAIEEYSLDDSLDNWHPVVVVTDNNGLVTNVVMTKTCSSFPYNIVSYDLNGVPTPDATAIVNQAAQDAFWDGLGFAKASNTTYTLADSTDVYSNLITSLGNVTITQSNCEKPLINDGISSEVHTDVLCNVELKKCGCIAETPENISCIIAACAPYLECCHKNACPTNTPQPYNLKGTYRLDETNLLIYFDSVNASTVLLSYYDDGNCEGEFFIPDRADLPVMAGIAFMAAQYDETVSSNRRGELERNYNKELFKFSKWLHPIRLNELVEALRNIKKF